MSRVPNTRAALVLIALAFQPFPASSQALVPDPLVHPQRPLTEYIVQSWGPEHHESLMSSTGFARTADGYVWISTYAGLIRFDGVEFRRFDSGNTPELSNDIITAIAADNNGGLWLATGGGGLVYKYASEFQRFGMVHGLRNEVINAILPDESGGVWVGTSGSGLQRFRNGTFADPVPGTGGEPRVITALAFGPERELWVGDARGELWSLHNDRLRPLGIADERPGRQISAILAKASGVLLVGTSTGLLRVDQSSAMDVPLLGSAADEAFVSQLSQTGGGSIWIATLGNGLFRIDSNGDIQRKAASEGLPSSSLESVYLDPFQPVVWLSFSGAGIAALRPGTFRPLSTQDDLVEEIVLPIIEDDHGTIWFGTYGGGLRRWNEGSIDVFSERHGLPSDVVLSLAIDTVGALWVGTRRGLAVVRDDTISTVPLPRRFQDTGVNPVFVDVLNRIWLGTSTGLLALGGGQYTVFDSNSGFTDARATVIKQSRDGVLFVGTEGDGLFKYEDGQFSRIPAAGPQYDGIVWDLHEDQQGYLWVATNNVGIALVDRGRSQLLVSEPAGFHFQAFRILEDHEATFWFSSTSGVGRIGRDALLQLLGERREPDAQLVHFDRAHGLPASGMNGGVQPAGWRTQSGELWFPTIQGISIVDPAKVDATTLPSPLIVEEIRVNGRPIAASVRELSLAPGVHRLELDFTTAEFFAPDRLEFSHRLAGLDPDWTAPRALRTAYYTNLRPGQYSFEIRTRRAGGPWREMAVPLHLLVKPHFYQTPIFFALIAATLAGVAFGAHRFRVRALTSKQVLLERLVSQREEAERRYRELFENANDMVFTIDLEGRVTSMNRKGRTLIGRHRRHIIRQPITQLVIDEDHDSVEAILALQHGDAGAGIVAELSFKGRDGAIHVLEVNARPIAPDEATIGIQAIGRDVTQRRELELQLQQSQKLQIVGQLAGGVAHDFNNLLTAILGYAGSLEDQLDDPSLRDDANEIRQIVERGARLTRQMLLFSRQEASSPRLVDVDALVTEMQGLLRKSISEGIDFNIVLHGGSPTVLIDRTHLEQVVLNLVVNARDAIRERGSITISTGVTRRLRPAVAREEFAASRDYVVLSCRDNGMGMSEAVLSRIFDPFYTTKPPGAGTGLGLSTVYGIVHAGDGFIDVHSKVGSGSTFEIYLPRAETATSSAPGESTPTGKICWPERVLLVEDEDAVRHVVGRYLRKNGVDVIETENGAAAIEEWKVTGPSVDVVITDLVMPRMGGADLISKIRSERHDVKVVVMSGYDNHPGNPSVSEVPRDASTAFLNKPFAMSELARALSDLLGSDGEPGTPFE